jgi:hypothetical protein
VLHEELCQCLASIFSAPIVFELLSSSWHSLSRITVEVPEYPREDEFRPQVSDTQQAIENKSDNDNSHATCQEKQGLTSKGQFQGIMWLGDRCASLGLPML